MKKRRPNFTTERFIEESQVIHGDIYDYSITNFVTIRELVSIICRKHGTFMQTPEVHLRGHGCFDCGIEKTTSHTRGNSDSFVEKSIQIHNNLYSYELVRYINNNESVKNVISKKTFGELYDNTIKKEKILKNANYTVVSIWENDFNA